MSTQLSSGSLAKICQGQEVSDPVLQVLGHKPIQGSGQERYRLLLSDGQFSNSFSMLATQLNPMIHENKLAPFTIIKVKKHICNQVGQQTKKVVVILEVEILTPGSEVMVKLGDPVQIGSDGKVPNAGSNQNSNPNAGAAPKRAAGPGGADQPPVKTTPSQVRSVLTPRAGTSSDQYNVQPISSITPYQNKWTIKARISSKTDVKTWNKPSGSGKLFSMDVMDDSGEIRVTAFKDQCDAFYEKAVVGKVFFISNCSVKNANKQYSKLNNEYELTFKDNGMLEQAEDTGDIPTVTYNFVTISDLSGCSKDSMVDVIGVVKGGGDATNITTKAGKELTKREITLVDRSNTQVTLTLWGKTAETFDSTNNPILAAKSVKVSDFNGVSLSGGDILVNPDLDLAHELKGWWDSEGCQQEMASITVSGSRGSDGPGGPAKIIGEVKQENLGHGERGDYYSVISTVTFFSKDKALYKACGDMAADGKECNKKVVEQGDGTYRCEKCMRNKSEFKWRIMLQLNMADCSDNVWASCFQENAEKILDTTSQELGDAFERDEVKYNGTFSAATFKTFNFRMRAKADTYNDETRIKHTIVSAEEVNHTNHCASMIKELEAAGVQVPQVQNLAQYRK